MNRSDKIAYWILGVCFMVLVADMGLWIATNYVTGGMK